MAYLTMSNVVLFPTSDSKPCVGPRFILQTHSFPLIASPYPLPSKLPALDTSAHDLQCIEGGRSGRAAKSFRSLVSSRAYAWW